MPEIASRETMETCFMDWELSRCMFVSARMMIVRHRLVVAYTCWCISLFISQHQFVIPVKPLGKVGGAASAVLLL